jgi:hypothetical protein
LMPEEEVQMKFWYYPAIARMIFLLENESPRIWIRWAGLESQESRPNLELSSSNSLTGVVICS